MGYDRKMDTLATLKMIGVLALALCGRCAVPETTPAAVTDVVALPPPEPASSMLLEEALRRRRSVRSFTTQALTQQEIGLLLWAAQGVTDGSGHRTAPSAGALYPLELYAVSASGVAHYVPEGHRLEQLDVGDVRNELSHAALDQAAVRDAAVVVVVTGVVARTRGKYGDRAERYVALEAGHAAHGILLEATALGLGAVSIGAFEDEGVRVALRLPSGTFPYYLVCVGHPRTP